MLLLVLRNDIKPLGPSPHELNCQMIIESSLIIDELIKVELRIHLRQLMYNCMVCTSKAYVTLSGLCQASHKVTHIIRNKTIDN